jgi:hypothetical protein
MDVSGRPMASANLNLFAAEADQKAFREVTGRVDNLARQQAPLNRIDPLE